MIRPLLDSLLAVLVAPVCARCAALLDHPLDGAVCEACWSSVARYSPPCCKRCGDVLPSARVGAVCQACTVALGPIVAARALGPYEGTLADLVQVCKYGRRPTVADRLGRELKPLVDAWPEGIDAVIPVPLHPARERERGFNQAERIAHALGRPVLDALRRTRATPPQAAATAAARRANVRGAFALERQARRVRGLRVALVDDVLTTGATLAEAASALADAQPREIVAITAARAVRRG